MPAQADPLCDRRTNCRYRPHRLPNQFKFALLQTKVKGFSGILDSGGPGGGRPTSRPHTPFKTPRHVLLGRDFSQNATIPMPLPEVPKTTVVADGLAVPMVRVVTHHHFPSFRPSACPAPVDSDRRCGGGCHRLHVVHSAETMFDALSPATPASGSRSSIGMCQAIFGASDITCGIALVRASRSRGSL